MARSDESAVPEYLDFLRLDGRGVVVVGAGQGMGRQSAHALAQQGARILCVDIDGDRADDIASEVKGVACVADARVEGDVLRILDDAKREFGSVTGIVDIVGMARWARLADMPTEDWDWSFDMCLRHAFNLCKHGGPAIAAAGGGSMVFIASVDGWLSAPFHAAYGAAKAGLMSLVRTAAIELRDGEVRVNAIAPGGTATPRILQGQTAPLEEVATGSLTSMGRTSDIASAVLFLSCDLSRHITGVVLPVDGGDSALPTYRHDAPPLPPGKGIGQA
jgi:NAD(P)-dependent dehydrogenase (short-subunit alcohol dehydrogenase family)